MSNDLPPSQPSDGSETGLGDLASGAGEATPSPPSIDSTQVMPVTPSLPANNPGVAPPSAGAVPPPGAPGGPGAPIVPTQQPPEPPWFKRPGAVAAVVTGVVLVGGVIALLFLLGGGDDEGEGDLEPEPVSFVMVRNNAAGGPLSTTLSAAVTVQQPTPDAYFWIVPGDGIVGQPATRVTDATGRTEFRWAPPADTDVTTWSSTVELAEFVSPEGDSAVVGLGTACTLERNGSSDALVVTAEVRPGQIDDSLIGIGSYTFPNVRFQAGDRVECTLGNQVATPPPTTVPDSTTIVPESTTTVPESTTTVPESTTTVPQTTTTSTTSTTTTSTTSTTSTTLAPSGPILGDALETLGLTETKALLEQVGLLAEIEALAQPYTLFAPDNAAIDDLRDDPDGPDLGDDAIVDNLLRAHLSIGDSLVLSELAALTEIAVDFGGPQPIDAGATPPTVGPAVITGPDNVVEGGIVHVVDATLDPQ
jgi:uncharacterized surface protein with fasciclin (FAS1) repeats